MFGKTNIFPVLAGVMVLVAGGRSQADPGPEAKGLIDEAILELRTHHVNRNTVDWSQLTNEAYAIADSATDTRSAEPAIRHLIAALGEKHTMFLPAANGSNEASAQTPSAAPRPKLNEPVTSMLQGGVGYVQVPTWPFYRDNARSEEWVTKTRAQIAAIDQHGVCGWIVDVRGNLGGNLWPMLDVLGPLLGAPPFGTLVSDTRQPILYEGGRAFYPGLKPEMPALPDMRLRSATAPLAVLMDNRTGSSGENVVMAFRGRANTRFFGQDTSNYVTMNSPRTLSDGSIITTTVGYTEDRTGFAYHQAIQPDERGEGEQILEAARRWVAGEGMGPGEQSRTCEA